MKIILASSSPRRKELLESIGLEFTVIPSDYEEESDLALEPVEYVKYLSLKKGQAVANKHKGLIISADTIVVFKDKIIGKPRDAQHAHEILSMLSDNTHSVFTGFTVICDNVTITEVVESQVYFNKVPKKEIDQYVATGKPLDKAGAYGVQDSGQNLVKKIDGCYYNVVGLPLPALIKTLEKFDIQIPLPVQT